jgi:hypothetical protein
MGWLYQRLAGLQAVVQSPDPNERCDERSWLRQVTANDKAHRKSQGHERPDVIAVIGEHCGALRLSQPKQKDQGQTQTGAEDQKRQVQFLVNSR